MTKSNYSELLRDPRWQKKRLEILQRDEFTCRSCFDSESTVHVHHCYYEKGRKPWEYEDSSLVTLCEDCHDTEAGALQEKIALCNALSIKGVLSSHFAELAAHVAAARMMGSVDVFISALAWAISDEDGRAMVFDAYFTHLKRQSDATERGE